MVLSPDKRMMPRFDETTAPGKITSKILKELSREEREGIEELALQEDVDERNRLLRWHATGRQREHARSGEIRSTDIVNELVLHEISKVTRRGIPMTIDEKLIIAYVGGSKDKNGKRVPGTGMIPEGRVEARHFFHTIEEFKNALDAEDYELVNAIFTDPHGYAPANRPHWDLRNWQGRDWRRLFESYDRTKRPEQNERLKTYLKVILERRLADLIDSGAPDDVDRFLHMVDGIDRIDLIEQACLPINPARITGNPDLEARTRDMLADQFNAGRRPKVNEALALGLVHPADIPDDIKRAAAERAAESRDPWHPDKTFESQAKELAARGAYGTYRDIARESTVIVEEGHRLLDILRTPGSSNRDWMNQIKRFDMEVLGEVFRPYQALSAADRAALKAAEEAYAKAVKEGKAGEQLKQQGIVDSLFAKHRRFEPAEFTRLVERQVKPILRTNLSLSLGNGIEDFIALRHEYLRTRTLSAKSDKPNAPRVPLVAPHAYILLTMGELYDPAFLASELYPVVRARLTTARAVADGGVTYALERNSLITNNVISDNPVTADAELARIGFPR